MPAPVNRQASPVEPLLARVSPDPAICILALIESLSGAADYRVEARNGELFITPLQPGDAREERP